MTAVVWPSEELPGPVPVRLEVPDEWLVESAPNVSFVAASPTGIDGVHSNIVVTVRRVDRQVDLQEVTELVDSQLAEQPGITARPVETVALASGAASLRRLRIDDPASGASVAQVQLVTWVGRTELVADVVTATLTFASTAPTEVIERLESTLLTLSVG